MSKSRLIVFRVYLIITAVIGLVVAADLYQRYHATGRPLALVLLGLSVLLVMSWAAAFTISYYRKEWVDGVVRQLSGGTFRKILLITSLFLILETVGDVLFLGANVGLFFYQQYQALLSAYFSSVTGVFGVSVSTLAWMIYSFCLDNQLQWPGDKAFNRILLIMVGLLGLWLFMGYMGVGYQKAPAPGHNFQPAPAPLIGIQAGLIFVLLMAGRWLWNKFRMYVPTLASSRAWHGLMIGIVFISAFMAWKQVPLDSHYFMAVDPTRQSPFIPRSDSFYYVREAQSWAVGSGFSPLAEHPLYLLFVGGLHLLGGDSLQNVIQLQLLLLAFIPVLIYLLLSRMEQRVGGLMAAGLFIIRERNRLLMMEHVSGSTVKMIMTELPAVLFLLGILFVCKVWFQASEKRGLISLLLGCLVGLSLLVRMEFVVLIPAILLVGLLAYHFRIPKWGRSTLLFVLGLFLVTTPWMFRNWQVSGRLYLDKYYAFRSFRNSLTSTRGEEAINGESRFSGDENALRLLGSVSGTGRAGWIDHVVNDLSQVFLVLPSNHQPLLTFWSVIEHHPREKGRVLAEDGYFSEAYLHQYVKGLPYHWGDWDGRLAARSVIPILFNSALVSVGVYALWRKHRYMALLMVLVLIFYAAGYALFKTSGGRFIQVVDWIPLTFYGVGLSQMPLVIANPNGFRVGVGEKRSPDRKTPVRKKTIFVGVTLLVALGLLLPASEAMIPDQYSPEKVQEWLISVERSPESFQILGQESLHKGDRGEAILGKALYPQYFTAGESRVDDRQGTTPDDRYARLEFYLVGTENTWVSLPSEQPISLDHGVEIVVKGSALEGKWVDGYWEYGPYWKADQIIIVDG